MGVPKAMDVPIFTRAVYLGCFQNLEVIQEEIYNFQEFIYL